MSYTTLAGSDPEEFPLAALGGTTIYFRLS